MTDEEKPWLHTWTDEEFESKFKDALPRWTKRTGSFTSILANVGGGQIGRLVATLDLQTMVLLLALEDVRREIHNLNDK